jgi:hypothetical protein
MFVLVGAGACRPDLPPPPAPEANPTEAWGIRLGRVVSADGEVDYAALRADSAALRDFVGWIAVHGPETDEFALQDDNRRLAWHLNAQNALVLWAALQRGLDQPGAPAADGPPLASLRLRFDGEPVRLDHHVTDVLALYEEPLAVAAMGCAARACPPVPNRLFRKDGIDAALARQMTRWISSGRLVTEDGGTWVFSPVLVAAAPAFARWEGTTSPCAIVAPYAPKALRGRLEADPACPHRVAAWDARLDGR